MHPRAVFSRTSAALLNRLVRPRLLFQPVLGVKGWSVVKGFRWSCREMQMAHALGQGAEENLVLGPGLLWCSPGESRKDALTLQSGSDLPPLSKAVRCCYGVISFSDGYIPPGGGNGSPLRHFCLENPMEGGVWRAIQSLGSQS